MRRFGREGTAVMKRATGFAMALVMAGSVMAHADDLEAQIDAGRDLYRTYCWQCHGADAVGNGPMAEMLAISTPDLTQLARANGGPFPYAAVALKVDGRAPVLAHGGDMPLFGPALEADRHVTLGLPDGQTLMLAEPLANLMRYLETVQGE
jgi:mono/diheme cytochrome c family protein